MGDDAGIRMEADTGESTASRDKKSGFWETMIAPWQLLSPRRAAGAMLSCSRAALFCTFFTHLLLLAGYSAFLHMWEESVGYSYEIRGEGWHSGVRTFLEVWRDEHERRSFGDIELVFTIVFCSGLAAGLVGAGAYLPEGFDGGGWRRALGRSFRMVVGGAGYLIMGVMVLGGLGVWLENQSEARGYYWAGFEWELWLGIVCMIAGAGLIWWLSVATRDHGGEHAKSEPPVCEGCGYDLRHVSEGGRCTECGLELAISLDPGRRRRGGGWQISASSANWLETTWELLLGARGFYQSVRVRDSEAGARRFAGWHLVFMGVIGSLWTNWMRLADLERGSPSRLLLPAALCFVVFMIVGVFFLRFRNAVLLGLLSAGLLVPFLAWPRILVIGGGEEVFAVTLITLIGAPVACVAVRRLVGSVVASWMIARRMIHEPVRLRTALLYETPYFWVIAGATGLLIGSFIIWNDWIGRWAREWIDLRWFFPPLEMIVLLAMNIGLGAWWIVRCVRGVMWVRWSNF